MIKRTSLLFALAMTTLFAMAQDTEKAKEILDKVSAKTKTYTSIYASFSFTLENTQENMTETHDGSIKIKGNKYVIDLMDTKTYFDGKTLWTHMIDAKEVNVSEPAEDEEGTLNPAKIFTLYETGFKYNYIGEKTENGKALYEIDLFPESREKPFSRIKLFINKTDLTLNSLKQFGKDGNNVLIKVKSMQPNLPYPDVEFAFNQGANPGVQVIDMR
jgi:outer membrane lipoprotein-sorting protein